MAYICIIDPFYQETSNTIEHVITLLLCLCVLSVCIVLYCAVFVYACVLDKQLLN